MSIPHKRLAFTGAALSAAVLVAVTACGSSSERRPTVAPATATAPAAVPSVPAASASTGAVLDAKFGQTYDLHVTDHYTNGTTPVIYDYSLTVQAPTSTTGPLTTDGAPPVDGYFVVFRAAIVAASEGVTYDSPDFSIRNAAGESTRCLTGEDTLGAGTLHAGQRASGTVVCDAAVTHGTLVWDPTHVEDTGSLIEWPF